MNENTNSVSRAELENFCEGLTHAINMHRGQLPRGLSEVKVSFNQGAKYARIVVEDGPSRYAYAFIDLSNGDILKPAGFKGPAKHARGNIRNGGPENWWAGACGPCGVAYLN